jgi:glutathione peroxidase
MKKIEVNGANETPLYTWLKSQQGFKGFDKDHKLTEILDKMLREADADYDKKSDIKWNFTKVLVDREGNVVARFEPTTDMAIIEQAIEKLL